MASDNDQSDIVHHMGFSPEDTPYIVLADGSLQVFESFVTPGAPSLPKLTAVNSFTKPQDLAAGGDSTHRSSGVFRDVIGSKPELPTLARSRSKMAAPIASVDSSRMPSDSDNKNVLSLQQQLLSTQQMCLTQQHTLTTLTNSVKELKDAVLGTSNSGLEPVSSEDSDSDTMTQSQDSDGESERQSVKRSSTDTPDFSDSKMDRLKRAKSSLKKEEEFSPPVHEELASTVNGGLAAFVDHKSQTVNDLLKKYKRPENCEYLQVPKVNKAVWLNKSTNKDLKDSDSALQKTHKYLTKGLVPLVEIMETLLQSKSEEAEALFDKSIDAFHLLAFAHRDLSTQRRRLLTPAISDKYKQLCSASTETSPSQLFGDAPELEKRMKEIEDNRKLGNTLVQTSRQYTSKTTPFGKKNTGLPYTGGKHYLDRNRQATQKSYPTATISYKDFLEEKARSYPKVTPNYNNHGNQGPKKGHYNKRK